MFRALWGWVGKLGQGSLNIARHGEVNGVVQVVPLETYAKVQASLPIQCDVVMLFEGCSEVLGMFLAHAFDAKIIDNKGEVDCMCGVSRVLVCDVFGCSHVDAGGWLVVY